MSEHESDLSDDDNQRINEVKKVKTRSIYQRVARPTTYENDDDDEDQFDRQLRLEKTKELQNDAAQNKTRVDPDGTVYEWDPIVKGWFPKVTEEFLVEHHMNYGLESSSGIRYDLQHQTYIQEREGVKYQLDKESQQWIPLESYIDEKNQIKYQFSKKHSQWIPDQSTYSSRDEQGQEQTYVWLKDQFQWSLLSSVDVYTDHLTGMKYRWNNETQSWNNEGIEPIEMEPTTTKTIPPINSTETSKKKSIEGWFDLPDEKNCNVYVTGLPLDMTDEEFEELMSKYGVIAPDPNNSRKKNVRLYRNEENQVKGDARCRFLKPESVQLSIDLLDETEIRSCRIHVERAKFQAKGTFNPELRKKRKKLDKKSKQKQVDKYLNWDEQPKIVRKRFERNVVMTNLFDLEQFKNDPLFIEKLRNQIRESSSEYGQVKKIYIYDSNPAGVAMVMFNEVEQADLCCQYMNERIWQGRIIQCHIWDGTTKYDVSASVEEEQKRIAEWHRYLNEDDHDDDDQHQSMT